MVLYTPIYYNTEVFVSITNNIAENIEENRYLIGNFGNVFDTKLNSYRAIYTNRDGYCYVSLHTNRGYTSYFLHRLVAKAFIHGDYSLQVNHMNGIKYNNYSDNLEWVTPRENLIHALNMGLNHRCEDKPNAILTNEEVHKICKMLEDKKNYYEISEVLGYNYEDIKDILIDIKRRKSWKTISCNYNFDSDRVSNNRNLTVDQVRKACEIYESNPKATASVIFKALGLEFDDNKERERMRHVVDSIKEKKAYKDISKNYNF